MDEKNGIESTDYKTMEDLDPSTGDGHRVIYDRECPFELRLKEMEDETPEIGTLEAIKVKILVLEKESGLESLKIELSSENDLFFYYMHLTDVESFRVIQESQKLMIDYDEYPLFVMTRDGRARLDFIQNMEYKFIELLSADFVRSPDDIVRQQISFRYNAIKAKLALVQAQQQDVFNIVKTKNPSLLLQMQQRSNSRMNGGSSSVRKSKV